MNDQNKNQVSASHEGSLPATTGTGALDTAMRHHRFAKPLFEIYTKQIYATTHGDGAHPRPLLVLTPFLASTGALEVTIHHMCI